MTKLRGRILKCRIPEGTSLSMERSNMSTEFHPAWIEINLAHIAHNTQLLKQHVGESVTLCAVVKGNGYGHGAVEVARTALGHGASWLAVAYLNEALALREAHLQAPILVMGYTPPAAVATAIAHDLALSLSDLDSARAFAQQANKAGQSVRVHIKVDTGMSRLGLPYEEAAAQIQVIAQLPGLYIEGLFTHFSNADAEDLSYTHLQLERFRKVLHAVRPYLPDLRHVHAANSAGTLAVPESHFNFVRTGIALYGLLPSPALGRRDLRPALAWKAHLALVKTLPKDTPVSYGNTWVTPRECQIAVLPVGYADGFRRAPQHYGQVLLHGQRAPIVGRVCMDQCMLDVTDILPYAQAGDEVVLIGQQGDQSISVDDVAARLGTINYEVVTALLTRVPRIYM